MNRQPPNHRQTTAMAVSPPTANRLYMKGGGGGGNSWGSSRQAYLMNFAAFGMSEKPPIESDLVECPRSEFLDRAIGFVKHYCTRAELERFGGVCQRCFEAIRHGRTETRHDLPPLSCGADIERQDLDVLNEHRAVGGSGQIEQVVNFDYAAVDRELGGACDLPPDVWEQAAQMVARMLAVCWHGEKRRASPRIAMQRFALLSNGMFPALLDSEHAALATELEISKQAMSSTATELQARLKIKFPNTRSDDARHAMAQARRKNPVARFLGKKGRPHPAPGKDSFRHRPPEGRDETRSFTHE